MSLKNCFEKLITFYELLNNRFFLDQGLFEPLVSVAAEIFKQKQRTLSSKKLNFFMKMVPETRKRPAKEHESRESEDDDEFSDELDDREEETSSIGSASVSEATSRSETPLGTGPGGQGTSAGGAKRNRKNRRKGHNQAGRTSKLQYK